MRFDDFMELYREWKAGEDDGGTEDVFSEDCG